jgi:hypothetical protein
MKKTGVEVPVPTTNGPLPQRSASRPSQTLMAVESVDRQSGRHRGVYHRYRTGTPLPPGRVFGVMWTTISVGRHDRVPGLEKAPDPERSNGGTESGRVGPTGHASAATDRSRDGDDGGDAPA